MIRKNLRKLLKFLNKFKFRFLLFLASFFLVTEVVLKLPFLNLYTYDLGWRIFIFYLLFIIWLRPSYNLLILNSIGFLIFGKAGGEVMGVLVYVSLLVALAKLLINEQNIKA